MFLDQLSAGQKSSFLALATRMVLADGDITDGERALLGALRSEMGDVENAPAEEVFGNTNLTVFDTTKVRAIVMLELFSLAFSDSDFHADEDHVLGDVGQGFGLDNGTLEAMRDWAQRRVEGGETDALVAEAQSFMES